MKITVDISDQIVQEFVKRSLDDETCTLQQQVRDALAMWNKISTLRELKRPIVFFLTRPDLIRAKQYNTIEEIE